MTLSTLILLFADTQMITAPDPAIHASILGLPLLPLFNDIFFGLIGMTLVLIFHGTCINHIIMRFEIKTSANLNHKQYNWVFFHFYSSFFFIAFVHLLEILIWSIFLIALGLFDNALQAILFSGSCYTTIGFVGDILPIGWKTLAFFIAFTGLFSIAWTTSVMIGMTNAYKSAWNLKYHHKNLNKS